MNNLKIIIKKELLRFFTDKKILFMLFFPGILIFLIYSLMGNVMENAFDEGSDYKYKIEVINKPEIFNDMYDGFNKEYEETISDSLTKSIESLENKKIDLVIYFSGDFTVNDLGFVEGDKQIEIYYQSSESASTTLYQYFYSYFDMFEDSLTSIYGINDPLSGKKFDISKDEDIQMMIMSMILPMIIIMMLFSSCTAIVPESISGEKERGTIATLLITPIKRTTLALGKIISLSVVTLISASSSYIGIILSLPKLMGGMEVTAYGIKEYLLIFLILISLAILAVGIFTIFSAQAKSVKEAGVIITPVMLIAIMSSVSTMFIDTSLIGLYFIPILNSALVLKTILTGSLSILGVTITIITNIVVSIICGLILAKMFNSEKMMYNK